MNCDVKNIVMFNKSVDNIQNFPSGEKYTTISQLYKLHRMIKKRSYGITYYKNSLSMNGRERISIYGNIYDKKYETLR